MENLIPNFSVLFEWETKGDNEYEHTKISFFYCFCSPSRVVDHVLSKGSTTSPPTFSQDLLLSCAKEPYSYTNKPKLKESSQTVSQTKKRSTTPSDDIVTPNAKKKKSEKPEANATPKPITVIPEIFKNQIYVKKDGFTKEKDTNNEEIHLAVPSEEKQNSISLVNSKTSGLTSQVEGKVKNSKAHKSSTLDFLGQSSSIQKHHVVEDYKKYKQISTE